MFLFNRREISQIHPAKVAPVTDSNTGLGKETFLQLANLIFITQSVHHPKPNP